MTTVVLKLPWAKPPLTANDSQGTTKNARIAKNRVVRDVRSTAMWLARSRQLPKNLDHVTVALHYQPALNRHRDASNLMPTQKALIDGLVGTRQHPGYGLTPGDDARYVTETIPTLHPAIKGQQARLWLEISWTDRKESPA